MKKTKKKILLFKVPDCEFPSNNKPVEDLRSSFSYVIPTISSALAYLGSFLQKYADDDYEIKLIDISVDSLLESKNRQIIPESLIERMQTEIKNAEYDVIGLSAMFLTNYKWTILAAEYSRKYHPQARIILGGGYSTILSEESLKNTKADYIVIGEGEDTLLFLLNKIFGIRNEIFNKLFPHISGYAYFEDGNYRVIPKSTYIDNLDLLPWPAWDLLQGEAYFRDFRFPIITTRGCPYLCNFCSVVEYDGRKLRCRSTDDILAEIDYFYKKYKIKNLIFYDDDVNINTKLFNSILKGLIDKHYDMKFEALYYAINPMKKETVELMFELGMRSVYLPVETGSPRMQKEIRKNINLAKAEEVFGWFKEKGFRIGTSFMLGFPQETIEDIRMTIDFARKIRAHETSFWIVKPWPGTNLYEYAIETNQLTESYDSKVGGYRGMGHFTEVQWNYEEVKTLMYDTNIEINFLQNLYFEDPKHYEDLYKYWHKMEPELPDHAILFICLGYLSKQMGLVERMKTYYSKATSLYEKENVVKIYSKYLDCDYKPILDYKEFLYNKIG